MRESDQNVVRGLYGVAETEGATTGLLVTMSSFTKDTKSFQDKNKYQIQLADHKALQTWLREHKQYSLRISGPNSRRKPVECR